MKRSALYTEGGHLLPQYQVVGVKGDRAKRVLAALETAQRKAAIDVLQSHHNGYKIPIGVRIALKQGFIYNQLSHLYPWAVYFWHPRTQQKKRIKCGLLTQACDIHYELHQRGIPAYIVSLCRGYDIPPTLRGKLPPRFKWCPWCMAPRKMSRVEPGEFFYVIVRSSDGRERERRIPLTRCPVCSNSNRSPIFRRSNQRWLKVKVSPGIRRIRVPRRRR